MVMDDMIKNFSTSTINTPMGPWLWGEGGRGG